jgi:hypothetical protein
VVLREAETAAAGSEAEREAARGERAELEAATTAAEAAVSGRRGEPGLQDPPFLLRAVAPALFRVLTPRAADAFPRPQPPTRT